MLALWQVPVITCIPSHSHGLIPFYVPLFLSSSLDDVMRIIIQLLKTILRTDWCTHDIRRWWWQNMRFQVVTSDSVPPPATVQEQVPIISSFARYSNSPTMYVRGLVPIPNGMFVRALTIFHIHDMTTRYYFTYCELFNLINCIMDMCLVSWMRIVLYDVHQSEVETQHRWNRVSWSVRGNSAYWLFFRRSF